MNYLKRRMLNRRFRRIILGLLSGFCLVGLLAFPKLPAVAQINQATIREILDSNQVFIDQKQAVVRDVAQFRQQIRTERARAGVAFSNGAAGRLGQNASILVGQCVEVERGQLLVSGPANGCVSGFNIAVQGTMYMLEKDPQDEEILGTLKVLENGILIGKQNDDLTPPTRVNQGQKVSVLANGELGPVEAIAPEEFADTVTGPLFSDYEEPLPTQSNLQRSCQAIYPNYDCTIAGVPVARSEPIRGLW